MSTLFAEPPARIGNASIERLAAARPALWKATRTAELTTASYWMIAAGVLMGLVAALFGFCDWLAVRSGSRAKSVGLWHGAGNVAVVLMFIVAWLARGSARSGAAVYAPDGLPIALEVVALLIALITAWLGGVLVERLGVGVDRGAHLDAPSSLSGRPAHEGAGEAHVPRTSSPSAARVAGRTEQFT